MPLDRARCDEERLCDLPVGEPLRRELGHSAFARGQRLDTAEDDSARPRSGRAKLGLRTLGEQACAGTVCDVEALAKQLTRLAPPVSATEERTEVGEHAGSLEPCVAFVERVDGLPEQKLATIPADDDTQGMQRDTERARRAEGTRQLELLLGEDP